MAVNSVGGRVSKKSRQGPANRSTMTLGLESLHHPSSPRSLPSSAQNTPPKHIVMLTTFPSPSRPTLTPPPPPPALQWLADASSAPLLVPACAPSFCPAEARPPPRSTRLETARRHPGNRRRRLLVEGGKAGNEFHRLRSSAAISSRLHLDLAVPSSLGR